MSDQFAEEILEEPLNTDEAAIFADLLNEFGGSRRKFLEQITIAGSGVLALPFFAGQTAFAESPSSPAVMPAVTAENAVAVKLKINGAEKSLMLDSRVTLLDALREKLQLTGAKKGCDHGQCGACTVLVDGRRVLSCLTLTAQCEGKSVTTIEGLATAEKLHPVQAAFVKHDGFQCGYCTPGQICSAVALLTEAKNGEISYVTADVRQKPRPLQLTDDEIRERMSGNICRCGAYPNIVAAVREVQSGKEVAQTWQFAGENPAAIFENAEFSAEFSREGV